MDYFRRNTPTSRQLIFVLLLLAFNSVQAQTVDYSVVAVSEEAGLNLTKVTNDGDCVCMPEVIRKRGNIEWLTNRIIDISIDNKKLAFLSFRNNSTNIFIKDIFGAGGTVQRTNRQFVLDFSYSPDGKNICFSEVSGDYNRIFVTDAEKGYICRQITDNDYDYAPVYAPDMSQIYFSRLESLWMSIWSYNTRGNYLSNISRGMNPRPTTDGQSLICVRPNANGRNEVWKINCETGAEECILSDPYRSYTTPSVSPDGQWILLVGSSTITEEDFVYQNTDIYVCRADGSQIYQLTHHAADDISPVWSRDGRHIYFISQRGSATASANVWRMDFYLNK